jgi:ADP-sugar diphosphatase
MDVRAKVENARTRGELVTLIICNYEDMWKVCPRDAKSLAAWALYESLNRAGIIQEELRERKKESMRAPTRETI